MLAIQHEYNQTYDSKIHWRVRVRTGIVHRRKT